MVKSTVLSLMDWHETHQEICQEVPGKTVRFPTENRLTIDKWQ